MRTGILALSIVAAAQVLPTVAADIADAAGMTEIAASLQSVGVAEAAFIRRGKLKQKQTIGYKVVVVVGDDAENNEVNTVDVSIPHVEGQPIPTGGTTECDTEGNCATTMTLPLKVVKANGNKRFVYRDLEFSDDAVNFSYSMTSTMKDANNQQVGESVTSTIEVEDDGASRVRSVVIRQLDDTNFELKVLVVGDHEGIVNSVEVNMTALSGPTPEPENVELIDPTVDGGKRRFSMSTLTFDDPSAAADEVYSVVVDLKNNEGISLGSSDYEIVVEGLEEARLTQLEDFVAAVHASVDQLELTNAGLQSAVDELGDTASDALREAPESFNVLLHELRGLALEVTLD